MTAEFLVGGDWRSSGKRASGVSPYDGSHVGAYFVPTADDVDDAVAAAADAHRAGAPDRHERSAWLAEASRLVAEQDTELRDLLVAETAKPRRAAAAELGRLANTLQWSAEEAKRADGDVIPLDTSAGYGRRAGLVTRVPVGPVLAITPFNYPLNLVAHKVGPALAAGCPVVVKPAPAAPLAALALARILVDAGTPPGFLSVLPVDPAAIAPLLEDSRVSCVSFTGSSEVGWRLRQSVSRAKVILELGGNAAAVVCRDANLESAVARVVWGGFNQAGQSCVSVQRAYVEAPVYDEFVEALADAVDHLNVGDPARDETDVGPLINAVALDRVSEWVDEALANGARARVGGKREDPFFLPTVLVDVTPDMQVVREELFGPVVCVEAFEDFEDVLTRVNAGPFGLQASVFTNDLARVFRAYERLEVGGLIVNDVPSWRADEMPYGGVKDSGAGREGISYAMAEFTEPRLLVLNGVRW